MSQKCKLHAERAAFYASRGCRLSTVHPSHFYISAPPSRAHVQVSDAR